MISSGKKVSSQQIDQAVESSVAAHTGNDANDGKVLTSLDLLPHARLIRLAMVDYERQLLRLTKVMKFLKSSLWGLLPAY